MKVVSLCMVFVLVLGCNSNDISAGQKVIDLKRITNLREDIMALADASVCNDETECAYIAFGSKACGGPLSYLVYSNSIDTDLLIAKVEEFNQMQKEFNRKYDIISDCSVVNPPTGLICENNKCIAVYN